MNNNNNNIRLYIIDKPQWFYTMISKQLPRMTALITRC